MTGEPESQYDALAEHYRGVSERRAEYLRGVDELVLRRAGGRAGSVLDVGAADGVRGADLAARLGAGRLVLAEPSLKMAELCRQRPGAEVWVCGAQSLPLDKGRFDVVLCLWNVLGHLADTPARVAAVRRMGELLAPGGRLFLDVNNRHNALAYGPVRVLLRRALDALWPDERRGDASVDWQVGSLRLKAMGHLFTPAELKGIFRDSGLELELCVAVDYATGRQSDSLFRGQLACVAKKPARPA